jgi:hypothetical protein
MAQPRLVWPEAMGRGRIRFCLVRGSLPHSAFKIEMNRQDAKCAKERERGLRIVDCRFLIGRKIAAAAGKPVGLRQFPASLALQPRSTFNIQHCQHACWRTGCGAFEEGDRGRGTGDGGRRTEVGGRRLEVGGWRLEVGGWRLEVVFLLDLLRKLEFAFGTIWPR